MTNVINSELFKLRTTRTFLALVGSALALVLVASILICALVNFEGEDEANEILAVVLGPIVRALALVIGILAVTNEFRHGTITPTLLVVPDRTKLMLAKLIAVLVLALGLGFVSGLLMVGASGIFGALRDFETQDALAVLAGSTFATALNAALGVGVGVLVRNQVGAIVGVLVFTQFIEPIARLAATFIEQVGDYTQYLPGAASDALVGSSIFAMSMQGGSVDQLEWWVGGLVLAGYAVVFLVLGYLTSWRRDVS